LLKSLLGGGGGGGEIRINFMEMVGWL